jgi:hypothetical protein
MPKYLQCEQLVPVLSIWYYASMFLEFLVSLFFLLSNLYFFYFQGHFSETCLSVSIMMVYLVDHQSYLSLSFNWQQFITTV